MRYVFFSIFCQPIACALGVATLLRLGRGIIMAWRIFKLEAERERAVRDAHCPFILECKSDCSGSSERPAKALFKL